MKRLVKTEETQHLQKRMSDYHELGGRKTVGIQAFMCNTCLNRTVTGLTPLSALLTKS